MKKHFLALNKNFFGIPIFHTMLRLHSVLTDNKVRIWRIRTKLLSLRQPASVNNISPRKRES